VSEWEGEVLELTRISRLDMGAYLCIASNSVPPTVSKRIKVSVDCKYYTVVVIVVHVVGLRRCLWTAATSVHPPDDI
jgi:hypothetical protein